jgi:hypothetical protein
MKLTADAASGFLTERLMGLEPTTFCMEIVYAIRLNACLCGFG